MTDARAVRVVVADDQELVRSGFAMIVDAQPDLVVVGEAADGEEAVTLARREHADVVLMDVRMPRVDGIEATRRLAGADVADPVKVVILTTFDLDEYVFEALRAGASGFLLKDVRREDLVHAVRVVAAGEALLAPAVTRRLIEDFARRPAAPGRPAAAAELDRLTPREREVLELIGRGRNNAEIGAELYVGEATVKTHVGRVLMKLDLRDRVQAVIYAYEAGLVGGRRVRPGADTAIPPRPDDRAGGPGARSGHVGTTHIPGPPGSPAHGGRVARRPDPRRRCRRGAVLVARRRPRRGDVVRVRAGQRATRPARTGTAATSWRSSTARPSARTSSPACGATDGVEEVNTLPSADGEATAVQVVLAAGLGDDAHEDLVDDVAGRLRAIDAPSVLVGGEQLLDDEVAELAEKDAQRAEMISLPIALVVMAFVFGGVLAAGLPLAVALSGAGATLLALGGIATLTDVSLYAVNVTLMLGIGLGIDYGLLIISRFREERGAGRDVPAALHRTMATAGRTVVFSAATVAVALVGLAVFPDPTIRSLAYGGVGVVLTTMVAAVTLLPALLAWGGHRLSPRAPAVVARPVRPPRPPGHAAGGAGGRGRRRRPGPAGRPVPARPVRRHRGQGAAGVVGDPPGRRGDRRPLPRRHRRAGRRRWRTWRPTTRRVAGWLDRDRLHARRGRGRRRRGRLRRRRHPGGDPGRGRDQRSHRPGRRRRGAGTSTRASRSQVGGDPAEIVDLRDSITVRGCRWPSASWSWRRSCCCS